MEDKESIIAKIDALIKELERLNVKQQTFIETIAHLRSRVERCECRKREIHNQIGDIKLKVRAWEAAQTDDNN